VRQVAPALLVLFALQKSFFTVIDINRNDGEIYFQMACWDVKRGAMPPGLSCDALQPQGLSEARMGGNLDAKSEAIFRSDFLPKKIRDSSPSSFNHCFSPGTSRGTGKKSA
jgi:hypothetical protein